MGVWKFDAETRNRIVELRNNGFTYDRISKELNIPNTSALHRACKHDPSYINARQKATEEEKEKVIKLRNQGLTYQQIAEHVGFSVSYIRTICVQSGLKETPIKKRDKYICELRANGLDYDEISKSTGVSKDVVQRVCGDNGCTYSEDELINV